MSIRIDGKEPAPKTLTEPKKQLQSGDSQEKRLQREPMEATAKTKANWAEFRGNNHVHIPLPDVTCGGSVSFVRHIGHPLSDELWEDLVHRFTISGLCIYTPRDSQWCLGWGPVHCIIELDGNDNVKDISITPHGRRARGEDSNGTS